MGLLAMSKWMKVSLLGMVMNIGMISYERKHILVCFSYDNYSRAGDINIGIMLSLSKTKSLGKKAYWTISYSKDSFLIPHALEYAVGKVNKNPNILPGLRLGFIMVDACWSTQAAVREALRFHPPDLSSPKTAGKDVFGVVGIVSGLTNQQTIYSSYVLGANHIPQLSFLASGDSLSSQAKHAYFLKNAPSNNLQMRAIIEFIARQGWSYFSVVYEGGDYGDSVNEAIKRYIDNTTMCIASSYRLRYDMTASNYETIVGALVRDASRSRVVVLIGWLDQAEKIIKAIQAVGAKGKLIWIGTDGWAVLTNYLKGSDRNSLLGSFTTSFYVSGMKGFKKHLESFTPSNQHDPWLQDTWAQYFNCELHQIACKEAMKGPDSPIYQTFFEHAFAMDAVYTYAFALDRLMKDKCQGKKGHAAANCVRKLAQGAQRLCQTKRGANKTCQENDLMLPYLRSTSFQGYSGFVHFDDYENHNSVFTIKQILPNFTRPVVQINVSKSLAIQKLSRINWDYLTYIKSAFSSHARLAKTRYEVRDKRTPSSVCSRLCEKHERKILGDVPCCWKCQSCKPNERLAYNFTRCRTCERFFWPDESTNETTCLRITPTYPTTGEAIVVLSHVFTVIGMLATSVVALFYFIYRNTRVIKASSRELSFLQLGAIMAGFLSNVFSMIRPSKYNCTTASLLMSVSYSGLYGSLLVKIIRIYRLFRAAMRGQRNIRFVKQKSQLLFASSLIAGQIILIVLCFFVYDMEPKLRQPLQEEKYVELFCHFELFGVIIFLSYNLTIIFLCSVFAFKTRQLPDNFNESRYISLCVMSTLLIWCAMAVATFSFTRKISKDIFLSFALDLNMMLALACLFVNRIYVTMKQKWNPEENFRWSTTANAFYSTPKMSTRQKSINSNKQYK